MFTERWALGSKSAKWQNRCPIGALNDSDIVISRNPDTRARVARKGERGPVGVSGSCGGGGGIMENMDIETGVMETFENKRKVAQLMRE